MEQTDELVPNPDVKGFLDLTNRAWVNLDPVIWGMYEVYYIGFVLIA
jgi:hypothetical protein